MHKVFWQILITLTFLLSACGQTPPQATPQPDQPTTTSSPLPTATATRTAPPSATPTASITPLPTIPTFTPTFDVSTIVTVTPAPKAECPKENSSIKLTFQFPSPRESLTYPYADQISEFLNKGGSPEKIISALQISGSKQYAFKDVTGDGVKDILMADYGITKEFIIFYCQSGRYRRFAYGKDNLVAIRAIQDLNMDQLPEIVISQSGYMSSGADYAVFSWKRERFENVAVGMYTFGEKEFLIKDITQDGVFEFILTGFVPIWKNSWDYAQGYPWRDETIIYSWNGKIFTEQPFEYSAPQYRFQAIQDADRKAFYSKYEQAIMLYHDTIFNDKLDWWSSDRKIYEETLLLGNSTLPPSPNEDPAEYPRLAAYAYYRIMLIHIVQNHESDAGTVYNTLQQKFGSDPYGRPYVEMATKFWNAYQSAHKMYAGCAAAIEYAVEHPEILIPLGSDYHGWQSHQYIPEDVCPFR